MLYSPVLLRDAGLAGIVIPRDDRFRQLRLRFGNYTASADGGASRTWSRVAGGGRRVATGEQVRAGSVPLLADGFSARPETAAAVESALVPGSAVVLVPGPVAGGGPGDWSKASGKTQVAVSSAEWLWQSGRVEVLVWITATSRASVLSGYAEAAVAATWADPVGDAETIAGRLIGWLAETTRPWLVVLDDLSDAAVLDGLQPAGPAGRVLITTSNTAAIAGQLRAPALPVGAFSPREALSYLMGRLTADPDQRLGAIDLVQTLGGEPLALAQASGVIAGSVLSCRDYLDYFARRQEHMARSAGSDPAAAAVTWTFSAERAEQLSPTIAQILLTMAALLDGNGIPAEVFATPAACGYLAAEAAQPVDGELARAALLVLERVGLLATGSAGTPTVRVNPVIQAAVQAAAPRDLLERAARAAADALLEAWPADEPGAWSANAFRSCAVSLQRTAGDLLWAGGCHPLLLRAGQSLDRAHLASPAVAYWRDLAAISEHALGPEHADTLAAAHQLAHAYLAAGRSADAISWFQWALADRTRTLGADHPDTIAARLNLGRALAAGGQFADAITMLRAAVGDYERVRGRDDLDTLGARDELAAACYAAGQFSEAAQLYRHTLAGREHVQGDQHPDTIATRQKLADAYLADNRLKHALSEYKRVLADREQVLGPDHLDTIAARAAIGSAYHTAGRMASALQFCEQAAAGYERVLGPDHPETLASRANLAYAYYAVGWLTDGLAILRDTAARCERNLPPGDPLTEAVRESLANIAEE
jgi:tetratricopeptide (TPR) repeat protein